MSREQFLDEFHKNLRGMTDIQRAARFFILIKESFGANCNTFGLRTRVISSAVDYLGAVSKRLDKAVIENQDFERLIKTYDRATALFYLDPPYYNAEQYYQDRFNKEDHERLRCVLGNIKGRFVLSYNDCHEIRELYKSYTIIEVERQNNLLTKTGQGKRYKELIIKNY